MKEVKVVYETKRIKKSVDLETDPNATHKFNSVFRCNHNPKPKKTNKLIMMRQCLAGIKDYRVMVRQSE